MVKLFLSVYSLNLLYGILYIIYMIHFKLLFHYKLWFTIKNWPSNSLFESEFDDNLAIFLITWSYLYLLIFS